MFSVAVMISGMDCWSEAIVPLVIVTVGPVGVSGVVPPPPEELPPALFPVPPPVVPFSILSHSPKSLFTSPCNSPTLLFVLSTASWALPNSLPSIDTLMATPVNMSNSTMVITNAINVMPFFLFYFLIFHWLIILSFLFYFCFLSNFFTIVGD